MFYEIDMAEEHIKSICNALDLVQNKDNVHIELFFNISEYFERIDIASDKTLAQHPTQKLRDLI